MKPGKSSAGFYGLCMVALSLSFCGPVVSAQILLPDPASGFSKPFDGQINVPIEKGKRPGLLFRFICQGGTPGQCFPLSPTATAQLTIGATVSSSVLTCLAPTSTTTLTCTQGITPAPNTCSYTVVDGAVPGDTIKIIYNGKFPKTQPVDYSVTGAHNLGGTVNQFSNNPHDFRFCTFTDVPNTVSVEMVVDISGSMALHTTSLPGATLTRMQALQDAAQILLAPGATLDSYAIPGDKLGLVFFSDFAFPGIPDPNPPHACPTLPAVQPPPPVVTNLLGADDPAKVSQINGCVQNQIPTRSTSIGAGLLLAKSGFDLDGTNTNQQVLLFSDGAQNTLPNVVTPVVNNVQIIDSANNVTTIPASTHICPVTAGPQVPPTNDLQQQIANVSCGGRNAHTPNTDQTFDTAALETYFAQSLSAILPTDKLEIVADTTGTISRGANTVEKFLVSTDDVKTSIALSWGSGGDGDRVLPFQLKAPDGTVIDLTNRTSLARHASFTNISFPLVQGGVPISQAGEWQLTIDASELHSPSVDYHLVVMSDNITIASAFSINAPDVGTGEAIPVQVKLTDNGQPILNATVQAQLMGPANSQGNVLSNTPTPPASGPGPDPTSNKGQAKLDSLFSDPANASLFADKSLPTVTLLDNSNTGVYTASFAATSNEGYYYFTIRVRGKSGRAGDFQRTFWIARFVRSKPDPARTVLKVLSSTRQANGTVLVTLQAIPHDALGNFLGPGYEKDMQIKSSAGSVENPLDDKLDGSYEITYRLPSVSSNPSFTIQIMGTTVTTKTLRDLRGQSSSQAKLALFLDAGGNIPQGTFGTAFNKGFSFNAGLEYIAHPHFSVEGIFGYHHFPGTITSALNIYQFSVNGKTYLTNGPLRPFVNGGVGGYKFGSGSTYFGGNVGAGVLYSITSRVGVQGSYNFHVVNTSPATKYSDVQGGIWLVVK